MKDSLGNITLSKSKWINLLISCTIGFLFYREFNSTLLETTALIYSTYIIFYVLKQIGYKFLYIDLMILVSVVQWILAPVLSYTFFSKQNELARIWETYMKIPSDEYFMFILPGTLLFHLGLKRFYNGNSHEFYLEQVREYLSNKKFVGVYLCIIGIFFTFLNSMMSQVFAGISYYFSLLTYVGYFYLLYSDINYKKLIVTIFFIFLVIQSAITAMFGELFFWTALIATTYIIGKNLKFYFKLVLLVGSMVFLFFIQSIKHELRYKQDTGGSISNIQLFGSLISDRVSNPDKIFGYESTFAMAVRLNQGELISSTMAYVPRKEGFAYGETIFKSILASIVPRIFWPNKPTLGGKDLIVRFLGAPGDLNYSYNISPIGEAYVNFGKFGGALFMLFYGIFYSFIFLKILKISKFYPSVVLWLPILFITPIHSMESDVLTGLNSLVKAIFFMYFIYKSFMLFFRIKI